MTVTSRTRARDPDRDVPPAIQRGVHVSRRPRHRRLSCATRDQRLLRLVVSQGGSRQPARLRRRRSDPAQSGDRHRRTSTGRGSRRCRRTGMGHVIDLVPNHMGIAKSANPWWQDVLENGPSSRFARFFDIEWHPVKDELADKVLIPILGDQYGAVLERQELQLDLPATARSSSATTTTALPIAPDTFATDPRAPVLDAWLRRRTPAHDGRRTAEHPHRRAGNLPPRSDARRRAIATRAREKEIVKRRLAALAERSAAVRGARSSERVAALNGVAGQPRSFDRARSRCSTQQSYRLAHWRVASEEINYRRFFDVNELAALRMEDPAVFDEVHRFVFELVAPRRGDRAAHRSRRRPVRARRLPAAAAGAARRRAGLAGRPTALRRRREDPRRRASSCRATGRCTARPATSSRAIVNNLFVDRRQRARARRHLRRVSSRAASGSRSAISRTAARSW